MPKKTKKQKIMSEYRKKIQKIEATAHRPESIKYSPIEPKDRIVKKVHQPVEYILNDYEKQLAKFTFHDLKKTIFIALIILVLEFLIFFANLNHTYIF